MLQSAILRLSRFSNKPGSFPFPPFPQFTPVRPEDPWAGESRKEKPGPNKDPTLKADLPFPFFLHQVE